MKIRTLTAWLCMLCMQGYAQKPEDPVIIQDKPGTFTVINWSIYGMSGNDYTKTEKDANYKQLQAIAELMRRNPVLADIKGFNAQVRLVGSSYDKRNGYGIPGEMSFEFCTWFRLKGKEFCSCIEPDHWDIMINNLTAYVSYNYGSSPGRPTEKPTNPAYNYEAWARTATLLSDIIQMPGKKETLEPGMDRYNGETVIVYDPGRPPYWVPVKIGEVFPLLIDYWRLSPDKIQADITTKILQDEYARFSEAERNSDAYAVSGDQRSPFANVGVKVWDQALPVMRINPAYWNKQLPRSAVQFLSFQCNADKQYLHKQTEEQLRHNSRSYYRCLFTEKLDIGLFRQLIIH